MSIFEKLKTIILYGGLKKDEYNSLKGELGKLNSQNLKAFSLVITIYLGSLLFVSLFNDLAKLNFWYYFTEAVFSLVLFVLNLFLGKKNHVVANILTYLFMTSLLIFGILIGSVTSVHAKAVIYPVFLFVVPLLFIDRPIKFDCLITLSFTIFLIFGFAYKDFDVFKQDLLNVIVLYLTSMVVSAHILKVRFSSLNNERKLSVLSDYDTLTQTKNRNCYERNKISYQLTNKNCQLIFIDVNGLHEYNNKFGHDAGDNMLKFIGLTIKEIFGKEKCYRIGGDEFVYLNVDDFDENIEEKMIEFKKVIEAKGYYASLGYAYSLQHVDDLTLISKKAEVFMYEEKQNYYHLNNIKRDIRR